MLLFNCSRLASYLRNPCFYRQAISPCHRFFSLDSSLCKSGMSSQDSLSSSNVSSPQDELVFVYGTLKRGEPNHYWFEDTSHGKASFVAEGRTVKEFPLVIATEYNIPMLLDKAGVGRRVKGEVWRVDEEKLLHLDVLEEHPKFYRREKRAVEMEGRVVTCWLYAMVDFKKDLLDLAHLEEYSSGLAAKYDAKYLAGKEDEELHRNVKGNNN